jgi:hypothetical protein
MGRIEWLGLVERECELEAIDAAVASVDEVGAGVFRPFDGEPGIGRGTLPHELTVPADRHLALGSWPAAKDNPPPQE